MRKLQKAAVVVAMLGGVGVLGAGTAQAAPAQDSPVTVTVTVTQECSSTGGEGGASGDAAVGNHTIGEASSTGGEGGAASTTCTVTISG